MSDQGRDLVTQARQLISDGEYQEAIQFLEAWLDDNPGDASGWSALGAAYFRCEDWEGAERAARRAVDLRPESAREWCNLGTILRKVGNVEEAREAQRRALELDSSYDRPRTEIEKLRGMQAAGHRTTHPEAPPRLGDARSGWLKWGLAALGVVCVAILCARALTGERAREGAVPNQQSLHQRTEHVVQEGQQLTEPTESLDAAAPEAKSDMRERSNAAASKAQRIGTARKLVRAGKALYHQGSYREAREAFVSANEFAPELNDPQIWIGSCDREIALQAGHLRYVGPASQRPDAHPRHISDYDQVAHNMDQRGFPAHADWWRRDGQIMDMNLPPDLEDALLDLSQAEFELDMLEKDLER